VGKHLPRLQYGSSAALDLDIGMDPHCKIYRSLDDRLQIPEASEAEQFTILPSSAQVKTLIIKLIPFLSGHPMSKIRLTWRTRFDSIEGDVTKSTVVHYPLPKHNFVHGQPSLHLLSCRQTCEGVLSALANVFVEAFVKNISQDKSKSCCLKGRARCSL
jgi:hypothetical protein